MDTPEKLNPIIEKLSRIDKMACEESEKAAGRREALLDEFEAEKAKINAALKAEADERLDALKEKLAQENKEKLDAVKAEYEARTKKLDEEYEQNSRQWAENIVNAVIGG